MPERPDASTVLTLEELALNAWPALSVLARDGWLLRLADGLTKRANSVHMLHPSNEPLADKIAWAEACFRRAGLPAIFRLTPLAPDGIEEILAARGYDVIEPSLVQVAEIDQSWRRHDEVVMTNLPDPNWIDAYARAAALTSIQNAALHLMLRAVAAPAILAHIECDGSSVAFGMAVVERGYVGFFDMLTLPGARRRGYGRMIMENLFAWAGQQGATRGTLQVVETNGPARALYEGFGFKPVYGYRYRVLGNVPSRPRPRWQTKS